MVWIWNADCNGHFLPIFSILEILHFCAFYFLHSVLTLRRPLFVPFFFTFSGSSARLFHHSPKLLIFKGFSSRQFLFSPKYYPTGLCYGYRYLEHSLKCQMAKSAGIYQRFWTFFNHFAQKHGQKQTPAQRPGRAKIFANV